LEDGGYKSRKLSGLIFEFPDKPIIAKKGYTYFSNGKEWVSTGPKRKDGYWKDDWVIGVTDHTGADHAYATYGYGRKTSNIVHEYIHMCGYGSAYHDKYIFKAGPLRSTYRKKNAPSPPTGE